MKKLCLILAICLSFGALGNERFEIDVDEWSQYQLEEEVFENFENVALGKEFLKKLAIAMGVKISMKGLEELWDRYKDWNDQEAAKADARDKLAVEKARQEAARKQQEEDNFRDDILDIIEPPPEKEEKISGNGSMVGEH